MNEGMTDKELIAIMIDKYADLQRIKKSLGDIKNEDCNCKIIILRRER